MCLGVFILMEVNGDMCVSVCVIYILWVSV